MKRHVVFVDTKDIDILEKLDASYFIYSDSNITNLLNLANKRNGILSSFDTKCFTINNIVSNCLLSNPKLNKDVVVNSIYSGFDILLYIQKDNDGKVKVTSIKEENKDHFDEVFSYKENTFAFHKEYTNTYHKVKQAGYEILDHLFLGE